MSEPARTTIAFIGFGEAAQAFASGWTDAGLAVDLRGFDIKSDAEDAHVRQAKAREFQNHGVTKSSSAKAAVAGADIVFSLVTADVAGAVAADLVGHLDKGALVLDGNSCAPSVKIRSAAAIDAAGARYVDAAIMTPVHPARHRSPMLLSGAFARDAARALGALDMAPAIEAGPVGRASSIKMLRSVMIKGIEALTAECLLAARRAGVDTQVIESLDRSFPGFGWSDRAAYNLDRMMVHGTRRAAEMREVSRTVTDLGFSGRMADAAALWHDDIGALGLAPGAPDFGHRADTVLHALSGLKGAAE